MSGLVGVEHAPPQQRRERADVGEVRPDVDADQRREHDARPAGGGDRHEQQRRGQVVEEVRERPRAITATTSSASSPSPTGRAPSTASASPWSPAARTMTPRPRTKTRKAGSVARASPRRPARPAASAGAASAAAPASATQTGSMPAAAEREADQGRGDDREREARELGAARLGRGARHAGPRASGRGRSAAQHDATRSRARRATAAPSAPRSAGTTARSRSNARRFVRFEIGSSSEARVRQVRAGVHVRARAGRSRAAVANTTGRQQHDGGVEAQDRGDAPRRRRTPAPAAGAGDPREPRAISAPTPSNSPSLRQPSASTRSAARKPIVGRELLRPRRGASSPSRRRRDEQQRRRGGDRPPARAAAGRPRRRGRPRARAGRGEARPRRARGA